MLDWVKRGIFGRDLSKVSCRCCEVRSRSRGLGGECVVTTPGSLWEENVLGERNECGRGMARWVWSGGVEWRSGVEEWSGSLNELIKLDTDLAQF